MDVQLPTTLTIPAPPPEVIAPGDDSILVVAQPGMFRSDLIERRYPAGMTLREILEDIQPNPALRRCSHVFIAGDRMRGSMLHRIRPKPGAFVNISCVPALGGGKKNPLRFILMLVVAAASLYVGALPALAGPIFAAGGLTWGALAGAAIAPIGSFATNAMEPGRAVKRKATQ